MFIASFVIVLFVFPYVSANFMLIVSEVYLNAYPQELV